MRTICISPMVQKVALFGTLGCIAAVTFSQRHEVRRYIKIETM